MCTENHLVILDYAGALTNIPRLTCYSNGCNHATLIRQSWMDKDTWNSKIEEFKRSHPFDKSMSWDEYTDFLMSLEPDKPEPQKFSCPLCGAEM